MRVEDEGEGGGWRVTVTGEDVGVRCVAEGVRVRERGRGRG